MTADHRRASLVLMFAAASMASCEPTTPALEGGHGGAAGMAAAAGEPDASDSGAPPPSGPDADADGPSHDTDPVLVDAPPPDGAARDATPPGDGATTGPVALYVKFLED